MRTPDEKTAARAGTRGLAGEPKGDKPKPPQHDGKVHKMIIGRGKNKGYTAHHVHHNAESGGEMQDAEPHIMGNMKELQSHIAEHMPEEMADEGAEGGGGEGGGLQE